MTTPVSSSFLHAYDDNGRIIINASNLKPSTAFNAKINFYDAYNNKFSYPLSSTITNGVTDPMAAMNTLLGDSNTLPRAAPLTSALVTTLGDGATLPAPVKTDFLNNYWNNDRVTYPLVRLYGSWVDQVAGNIRVTLNGVAQNIDWAFYNNEFKVYVKLSSSTYPNGRNDIILSCNGITKTLSLYFNNPSTSGTTPHIKCILYDAYDGDGICDTIPGRNDNTQGDNEARVKLDMMLLQSFFAESMRSAREFQEGIIGLPYSTFALEMENDEPKVYYLRSLDSQVTRLFVQNLEATTGAPQGDARMNNRLKTAFGSGFYQNGGHIYTAGYSLISHKIPNSNPPIYYGNVAAGGNGTALMPGGNLIWHPKSLDEFQACWNNTASVYSSPIFDYIHPDNAGTPADSCARIIGSLMHEISHGLTDLDHPDGDDGTVAGGSPGIFPIVNRKPLSYIFSFDKAAYPNPFGIENNDASSFRDWVMSYNYDATHTPISRVNSDLGPSSRGWFSPLGIQGYVSSYDAANSGARPAFLVADTSLLHLGGSTRIGYRYNRVIQPHPKESAIQTISTAGNTNITIPSDLVAGYIVANVWGAGGGTAPGERKPNGGAGGFVRTIFPIRNTDTIKVLIGNQLLGGGGMADPASSGPYAGVGGGNSVLYVNGFPVAIAAGGGGGGQSAPGISVLQEQKLFIIDDGDSGTSAGAGQPNFAGSNYGGAGGGGWYGGDPGLSIQISGGGGGAGKSYSFKNLGGTTFEKAGVSSSYSEDWSNDQRAYTNPIPCKHIPLTIFDTNPTNIGTTFNPGCIKFYFIYTSLAKNESLLTQRVSVTPPPFNPIDYSDNPSFRTILPRPSVYTSTSDRCILNKSNTPIIVSSEFQAHAGALISDLQKFGVTASSTVGTTATASESTPPILLIYDSTLGNTDNNYYKHRCVVEKGKITVSAGTITGLSFGTATILQLLRRDSSILYVNACNMYDYSTCHRSGIMIDSARSGYNLQDYYTVIDLCRFYKMRFIHVHATDSEAFLLPWRPSPGVISSLDSEALTRWMNVTLPALETFYTTVKNYGSARGVHLIPEWEVSNAHWYTPFPNTITPYPTTLGLIASLDLISKVSDFFDTSEYFHIGNDEGAFFMTSNTSSYNSFGTEYKLTPNIINLNGYWYHRFMELLESKGKQMITWDPVNATITGTDGTVYSTFNRIAHQVWLINGGHSTVSHYGPEGEDYSKNDIHSQALNNLSLGIPTFQTPWKPRVYNSMRSMFEWSVGGQISTTNDGNTTDDLLHASYPLPITKKLLGSQTLLWVTGAARRHYYFVYKAPIRNENTYSFGKPSINAMDFGLTFNYLDARFIELRSGVRIIENGIAESMADRINNDNDDAMIPTQIIRETASVVFILNNPTHQLYYVVSPTDYPASYSTQTSAGARTSSALLYSSPIQITPDGSIPMSNGFTAIRAQVYDSSGSPVGGLITRKYTVRPFKVNIAGAMTNLINLEYDADISLESIPLTYYFNERATISVTEIVSGGNVRYAIGEPLTADSPILSTSEQLNLTGTVPNISIGYFKNEGFSVGNVLTYKFLYTQDTLNPSDLKFAPFSFSKTPKASFSITQVYNTAGTQIVNLLTLLSAVANCPGGVKITATVVGAGGSTVTGGAGGGSGGATTEIYNNIDRIKLATITVGNSTNRASSVSFAYVGEAALTNTKGRSYFPPGVDRDRSNAVQHPIYPTIANGGTDGTISTPGIQGITTKGRAIALTAATTTSGGAGHVYNGTTYGNGAYGATAAGGGLVVLVLEPL